MAGWIKIVLIGVAGAGLVWLLVTGLPIEDVRDAAHTDWDKWQSQTVADFDQEVLRAQTDFAFELFSELIRLQPSQNVFVSPISVTFALSMTLNGAAGTTYEAMADVLEIQGLATDQVNRSNAGLLSSLAEADWKVRLAVANSLWARKDFRFYDDFLNTNKTFYRARVKNLDFRSPQAAQTINDWVNRATDGRIPQIAGTIPGEAILYLVNAVYFKGEWQRKFSTHATSRQPFYLLDGTTKKHPRMHDTRICKYLVGDGFRAVGLAYGRGRVSMYVFLPDKDVGLDGFLETLNADSWDRWMEGFQTSRGGVGLPKFRFEYGTRLNGLLKRLGMGIAFDGNVADFSGMLPDADLVCISDVRHKTFVAVDEQGTEAAAATAVEMMKKIGLEPMPEFTFIVDRPFFFAIRDNLTGTILFMGVIVEPV